MEPRLRSLIRHSCVEEVYVEARSGDEPYRTVIRVSTTRDQEKCEGDTVIQWYRITLPTRVRGRLCSGLHRSAEILVVYQLDEGVVNIEVSCRGPLG